ncbi:MAG: hypothetical protein ACYSSM_05495 [Planctomycetota bacterium]|jgi:hypothetical protein
MNDPLAKIKAHSASILPGDIRKANDLELAAIKIALERRYFGDDYILDRAKYLAREEVMIREDYISDGPGFAGKLAVIFWGEPQFMTVIGDNGSTDTNWEVIDVEMLSD